MPAAPAPQSSPEQPSGWRRWLPIVGTILVVALGAAVAARTIDLGEAIAAVRTADPLLLAAAVLVYTASWPLRGRRYGDVLAPMQRRIGTRFLTGAVLLSQTANLAIPARGGDAVRALLLKRRRGVAYATGVASLAVERVFDLLAIGVLGGSVVAWLVWTGEAAPVLEGLQEVVQELVQSLAPSAAAATPATTAVPPAVLAGAGAAVALVLVLAATILQGRADAPPTRSLLPDRIREGAATAAANLATLARRPRALAAVGAGSLAIWALDAATAILVLAAVASPEPVALLAVGTLAVCAGNLAKVLPLTQGGIGLYEGAFAATVVGLSPITGATALAAAVLDHALKNGVTLAGGALAGAWFNVGAPAGVHDEHSQDAAGGPQHPESADPAQEPPAERGEAAAD